MEKRRIFVKKTRLHINYLERTGDRGYSNRTKILLFIPKMLFFDIDSIEGEVKGQETYASSFITEKGIDTAFSTKITILGVSKSEKNRIIFSEPPIKGDEEFYFN